MPDLLLPIIALAFSCFVAGFTAGENLARASARKHINELTLLAARRR